MIQDIEVRTAIDEINRRLDKITNTPQISKDTTLVQLIAIVNKILNNRKRK